MYIYIYIYVDMYVCVYIYIYILIIIQRAPKTCHFVKVQLLRLRRDLRTGSISRDIVNSPSELCRRRSCMITEVARLVPPDLWGVP